jgi:hypothetical protein
MASIGWIDFSPTHRDRVGSVLDLLRPEGMVDELGLGTIRDAIANELFPGISTIQTRAKYFFIVPYILQEYQAMRPSLRKGRSALQYLENEEYEIMWQLAEHYNYTEGNGVIGITKRRSQKEKIVRRPSAIYWNGLNTYRFIDSGGLSANNFLKRTSQTNKESFASVIPGDGEADDADVDYENILGIKIPASLDWRNGLTLDLTYEEAEFFRDRIQELASGKLISELLLNEELWDAFITATDFAAFARMAVVLPIPSALRANLTLAHDFSELMYGAHLAYNCQVQTKLFRNTYFDADWQDWVQNTNSAFIHFQEFNPDNLMPYSATTRTGTKHFVRDWWEEARVNFPDLIKRDKLIHDQEAIVKGRKARLPRAMADDVKEESWTGLGHFEYRFSQAKTILKDIKDKINP